MYYSYVEIEYVATSFSPARTDLALKLLKSTFQMLTDQLFLAHPSVTQMSNDVHLLGVAGAAGMLAGVLPPSH